MCILISKVNPISLDFLVVSFGFFMRDPKQEERYAREFHEIYCQSVKLARGR